MTRARWLSIGEASEYTGLSRATLKRYEAAGDLASVRTPGEHRRYSRTDLDAFLEHRLKVLEYRKRKRRNHRLWLRRLREQLFDEVWRDL